MSSTNHEKSDPKSRVRLSKKETEQKKQQDLNNSSFLVLGTFSVLFPLTLSLATKAS